MALPKKKIPRLHSWQDYALFLMAAAFCVFSAKAFFRAPPRPSAPQSEISRGLASVGEEQPLQERSTRTMSFSCQEDRPLQTKTESSLLRLTAEACSGKIERVTNRATGELLMIFERGNEITTHYFPLKSGKNEIMIEWKGKRKPKLLEVERSS